MGVYQASDFTLALLEEWKDQSVYLLEGPEEDGLQHFVTIQVDPLAQETTLVDYVDWMVRAQEEHVPGCRLCLKKGVHLGNGLPACRVVFVWHPAEGIQRYQEQVIVLFERQAYRLSAMFTRKTRRTLGPIVWQVMMGFQPAGSPQPPQKQERHGS